MEKILLAIDFSPTTPLIIEKAKLLASKFNSEVWLIHAAPPDPDFVGYQVGPDKVRHFVAETLSHEHHQLQLLADDLRQEGINAIALSIQGPTIEVILQETQKLAADLIIIGSHGHNSLYKALVGSVSEGILRHVQCPILVIPASLTSNKNV
jgi:nucleotide-binding universal stress UspA family protein